MRIGTQHYSYSVTAVRHLLLRWSFTAVGIHSVALLPSTVCTSPEVTHLHNVRPWAVIRAVRGRPITKDCAI